MKKTYTLIILTILLLGLSANANSYDDEQLRRDAQTLENWDKAERKAAQDRYDKAHRKDSPNDPLSDVICIVILGAGAFGVYKFFYKLNNAVSGANQ